MEIFYPFCELYIYGKEGCFCQAENSSLSLENMCRLESDSTGVQSRDGIDIYKNTTEEEGMNLCVCNVPSGCCAAE